VLDACAAPGGKTAHLLELADLDLLALDSDAQRLARVGDTLRRLQLAAQAHEGPVFLLRGIAARREHSPAPLRLALHASPVPDEIVLHLLKRRGPPLAQPLRLVLPPVLSAPSKARALERLVAAAPRSGPPSRLPGPGRVTQGVGAGQDVAPAARAALEPRRPAGQARLGTG
jgi:hypothetical protein